MKINPSQLASQLNNCKGKLPAVIMVFGDEPLQVGEACDHVRQVVKQNGFTEREVFHVDKSFDWEILLAASNTLSLFSDKRLIELRIPNGKPGDKGSKALVTYLEHLPEDTVLLIISGKIESQSQKSKWFKQIEHAGMVCQIWPVDTRQMPAWIEQRMRNEGLKPTREAVQLLSERVEGNLLAAAQEISKLSLLYNKSGIDVDEVLTAVSDNSRYTIFELADASLAGDTARAARILNGLRAEGVEPILVLWALSREIRDLCIMSAEVARNHDIDAVLRSHRVWEKRKPLFRQCLQRQKPGRWQNLLIRAGHLDKLIKGVETGNIWDELLQLSLQVANVRLPGAAPVSRMQA